MTTTSRVAEGPPFAELEPSLRKQTLAILKSPKFNFAHSTPVQAAVIGLLGKNKDVSVEACTGSGKTLAFVLPMIEILWKANKESKFKKHSIGAVIVSPTRELAKQIRDVAEPFLQSLTEILDEDDDDDVESKEHAKFSPDVRPMLLVGGGTQTVADDLKRFSELGSLCLIGTPGRMLDVLTKARDLDAKRCELLVLDEADRVLGMGFAKTLNSIIAMLPKQRRTGLFSATQTEELEELARAGLRNPVRVTVRDSNAAAAAASGGNKNKADKKTGAGGATVGSKLPTQLDLSYRICESVDAKIFRLTAFLKAKKGKKIIVYFLTCACVDYYQKALETLLDVGSDSSISNNSSNKKKKTRKNGSNNSRVELFALHGKMKQAQREQTLEHFAENKEDDENGIESSILLTTDVAARGLDIPGVDWIVQYDMPQDPSAFTHRVGRTARMGAKGSALALLTKEESSYVAFLKIRGVYLRRDGNCRLADGDNGDNDDEDEDDLDIVIEEDANGARKVYEILRALSKRDREAMEKGVRAFVSYVRGYKEHHCRYIFRLKELHLAKLANAMGLLRLPKMKEIRKAAKNTLEGFEECTDIDIDDIPYLDHQREKQRKMQLEKERAQKEGRAEEEEEEDARKKKENCGTEKKKEKKPEKKLTAHKRRQIETREELDELDDDYRALKKWKKGKISEEEFEFELGWEENPNQAGKVRIKEGEKDKNKYLAHPSSSGKKQQRKEDLYRNGDDLWKKEKKKPKHVKQSKGGQGKKYQKARERAAAKAK
tara:strand:- start:3217 stop:5538 length:2322 start_codon:yes stop_codon:yes gene_type:complete